MPDVIYEMSRKGLGMTCVVDDERRARRHHHRRRPAPAHGRRATHLLERTRRRRDDAQPGHDRAATTLAVEALHILEQRKITSVVVVDVAQHVLGVVHLHDLWRTENVLTSDASSFARQLTRSCALSLRLLASEGPRDRALPLAVLVALLVGLGVGKAWERYKLRDGRWIDRRRLRETPHYMLGLNFLVDNQVDQAIDELTQATSIGTATRSRSR